MDYGKHFSTRQTPQGQAIPGETMVRNNAKGFAFEVSKWTSLERFLIIGTEGGTYYASEQTLTVENAENVLDCIKENGLRVVQTIAEISQAGRAPKNDQALFALALCSSLGEEDVRRAAFEALPAVARTGTHLLQFTSFMEECRGWGRSARRGVGNWFLRQTPEQLGYQFLKYAQRGGWSMRDLLRLTHPKAEGVEQNALFNYITKGGVTAGTEEFLPRQLLAAGALAECNTGRAKDVERAANLISEFSLPREAVPTELLNSPEIWEALLPHMGMMAMIRNLGKMSQVGLVKPMSAASRLVVEKLRNDDAIRKARVHPISILSASMVYGTGAGLRGKLHWTPVTPVIDALDGAFYAAFKHVEPTGKRILIGLDVSGSMNMHRVNGMDHLTARTAAAAMCLATVHSETNWHVMAFTDKFVELPISSRQRLADVVGMTQRLGFGRTNVALPMLWALENQVEVDAFVVYTDNETWYGDIHPVQALRQYRDSTGIPAKLITCAMAANKFSVGKPSHRGWGVFTTEDPQPIADPTDGGMIDLAGFDSAAPAILADFVRN